MTVRTTRPFSIGRYVVIVFAFSWPFQLAFVVLGDPFRVENVSGLRSDGGEPRWNSLILSFITSFAITLLPAFGEEFS